MKGYIDGIPIELEESAMIDGCSRLGAFRRVVLPVAATGLAATVIFAFILSWNEFFYAMNFTQTLDSKTLPVLLTEFSSKFGPNFVLASTAGVIASVPPVLVALLFQKYIISGLSSGAVKG
jgi:multiple sugar transport system permease protein